MIEKLIIKLKYPITLNVLQDVIEGKDTSISQSEAVHLLSKGNFSRKYKVFDKLLKNPNISILVKYLAFLELGIMNTIKARDILLRSANIVKDEKLLISILRGLGYCGDRSSIKTILKIRKGARGSAHRQAEFNADLISYRLNLKETDFLVQERHKYLNIPDESKSIDFRSVLDKQEIKRMFASIRGNPFGIRLARSPIYEIKTGNIKHFLMLNEKFSAKSDVTALFKRKAILGLIIREIEDTYSIMHLILSAPDKRPDRINILISRSNGNVKFRGFAMLADNVINFFLKSVLKLGNLPLLVEGSINIKESKLKISNAKFSPHIYRKKKTLPGNPKDEKWTIKDESRRSAVLQKFIGKIANEHKIKGEEAVKLIMKQKDLLRKAADEIGTADEAYVYYRLKDKIDAREQLREYKEYRESGAKRPLDHIRVFEKDTTKPKPGKRSTPGEKSIEVVIDMPGIEFPIVKNELIGFAKHLDNVFGYKDIAVEGFYYDLVKDLPDKEYANISSLSTALIARLNNTKRNFFGENKRVVDVEIVTTKEETDKQLQQMTDGKKGPRIRVKNGNNIY